MTPEQARKELVKVAVGFKLLQSGWVSTASEEEVEKLVKWLDKETA
jgi:hypothetical protein